MVTSPSTSTGEAGMDRRAVADRTQGLDEVFNGDDRVGLPT